MIESVTPIDSRSVDADHNGSSLHRVSITADMRKLLSVVVVLFVICPSFLAWNNQQKGETAKRQGRSGAVSMAQSEADVRKSVQAFYDAYNAHEFDKLVQFTTEDWTHITPTGIVRQGRAVVLQALRQVHSTFLRGVTDTPEEITVRFATADVALAAVRSRTSPFTSPDGVRHENEGRIRTFVLVKRENRWLILQDQNTVQSG